jgi:hypothetical protein
LYNFSGFRIVFHSTSIVNEEGLIYPIYPWGELLMGSYIKEKKASNVVFEKINYKLKYLVFCLELNLQYIKIYSFVKKFEFNV